MSNVIAPPRPRTIGPVADLEKHLPSDWWRTLFNSIYLKTDGDVVEHDENTQSEVQLLIKAAQLKPSDRVLDLCCGQGRHTLELFKQGFQNAAGIDRSRYLIRVAKKRAQLQKAFVQFSEGDARKIRLNESSFDCVVLFGNSFGYFESQEDDLAVLNSISRVLKSEGTLALDIVNGEWMRTHFEPRSWEWIDETFFVCRERSLSKDSSRIISREVVVHAEKGVIADQFYAERLYSFEGIKNILQQLGYTSICQHETLKPESTRNQDLGMMANRMFITAQSPKKIARPSSSPQKLKTICVIMGDPRLEDKVKYNNQFNKEDYQTITKLKAALQSLDYDFKYIDDHSNLIKTLFSNKPQFVLNLCDEGFNNLATQELHVPALLEMLKIPYSGANPSSLALCYNKSLVRSVAQTLDIPVPSETYFDASDQAANLPSILPALLKPNFGDSSIGITQDAVVDSSASLVAYIDNLKMTLPNTPILIQEYLPGNEYSVGIIGNPENYTTLPILEVDYSALPKELPKILGYESKWIPDSPYWSTIKYHQAELSIDVERQLIDYSIRLFERLGCNDYARFDFRTDQAGEIKLLEVNPNPGWCWDGKLNYMAGFMGKTYSDLLSMVLEAALERYNK